MNSICLTFYSYELQKHHGRLLHEWLLEFAVQQGLPGGSAFRGIAGFGLQRRLHEEHFFELASDVPVEVKFILSEVEASRFLQNIQKENVDIFYTTFPIQSGRLTQ